MIPPTIHHGQTDPECQVVDVVANESRCQPVRCGSRCRSPLAATMPRSSCDGRTEGQNTRQASSRGGACLALLGYLPPRSAGRKFSMAQISLELIPDVNTIRRPSG